MNQNYTLEKNKFGFYEISPKPTQHELSAFYEKKYYQENRSQYQSNYTDDEKLFFRNSAKLAHETLIKLNRKISNLLDLGCGEGFFANYFHEQGVDIFLNDYSSNGIERHNPHLLEYLEKGDSSTYLENSKNKYDFISLNNVLEHVIDPEHLMASIKKVMHPDSVLRITVPNDFSAFQMKLLDNQLTDKTWIAPPEHLSYFNVPSLKKFCVSCGFDILSTQSSYPIEQFLVSPNSNYWKDRSLGKSAHLTRVFCVNYLSEQKPQQYINYMESAAELEFGRDITIYIQLAKS
ncbi:MAG: class I SAM-dependent methyltransferase [Bdellovibrionales bacterium]|nr:class I SAM-dependent methyltransferase [Bdellovibrionales bacterium]